MLESSSGFRGFLGLDKFIFDSGRVNSILNFLPKLLSNYFLSDGYAPFLSMTGRETFLDVSDSVMAAPGPGQYDPSVTGERVKGGHTLANRVRIIFLF